MNKKFTFCIFSKILIPVVLFGCCFVGYCGAAEATALEGKWVGKEHFKGWVLQFSDNHVTAKSPNPQVWYEGTFALIPDTDPNQIDISMEKSGIPAWIGKTTMSIFKLDGDTLTLAMGEPGSGKRATSFSVSSGVVLILIKEHPEKKQAEEEKE
jgi:uncharacterized protein (TIGR03067 family)